MSNHNENVVDKNIKVFSVSEIYSFHFWKVKFPFMAGEIGHDRSCQVVPSKCAIWKNSNQIHFLVSEISIYGK